ncbi:MAG: dipeptidase, partial [Candidatus Limnocylindria bacterium]
MNAKQLADELRPSVRASMTEVRAGLERLARVSSMSAPGYDPAPVRETARLTAELFTAAGVAARVVAADGAHPAVVGRVPGPKGSPTVLLYAHHDVQPPGPRDRWTTDPFA